MFSPIFALMAQTLQLESKLVRVHVARLIYLVILFFALMLSHASTLRVGAAGLNFFSSLTWYNIVVIFLAGISFFSSVIAEEKEESTIGLLKMAGISPLVLLLGKSSSRLITAVLFLAVQIPFTLLAITLGGVTLHQILSAYAALFAFLVLIANVGLFTSLIARSTSFAAVIMGLFYFFFFLGPLFFQFILRPVAMPAGLQSIVDAGFGYWSSMQVTGSVYSIMSTGFDGAIISFQVVSNIVLGILFFLASWGLFEYFTREKISSDRPRRWFLMGRRKSRQSRRVWSLPLAWKDFYYVAGGKKFFVIKLVAFAILVLIIAIETDSRYRYNFSKLPNVDWEATGGIITAIMCVVLPLELCWAASNLFTKEIKEKTFSSLFLLPSSVAKITYSKLLGYLIGAIPAALTLCVGLMLLAASNDADDVIEAIGTMIISPLFWYGIMSAIFLVHLVAYLSLVVKWGAFILSIVLFYFVNGCFVWPIFGMLMSSSISDDMVLAQFISSVLIIACAGGMCAALQVAIGQRLDEMATR